MITNRSCYTNTVSILQSSLIPAALFIFYIISSHCRESVGPSGCPSCHATSYSCLCDCVLTGAALTWWEEWKWKLDSMHTFYSMYFVLFDWVSVSGFSPCHIKQEACKSSLKNRNECLKWYEGLWLCLCSQRMGLSVDSPDSNNVGCGIEQQGEDEQDDRQTETCTSIPFLPSTKKKRKGKRRYVAQKGLFVLFQSCFSRQLWVLEMRLL